MVGPDLKLGRAVLEQLAREQFPLKAAAWVLDREDESWRLYLVTPIRNRDLLDAYLRASEALLADAELKDEFKLVSFKIVDPRDAVAKKLVEWGKRAHGDHQRISSALVDGRLINAVAYRLAA